MRRPCWSPSILALILVGLPLRVSHAAPNEPQRAASRRAPQTSAAADPSALDAAVLEDRNLSPDNPPEAEAAIRALIAAGYRVSRIDASFLSNPIIMNRKRFRLLALPAAGRLPSIAGASVEQFVKAGGSLFVMGAPAWSDPLVEVRVGDPFGGATTWISLTEYDTMVEHVPAQHILYGFDPGGLVGWTRTSNDPHSPAIYNVQGSALHVKIANLTGWDTFLSPSLAGDNGPPFAPGETLTSFRARGDGHTPRLAIEWDERDGSRWIGTVPLTTRWQTYSLTPNEFHYWQSTPGRGGPGDQFHPQNAVRFSVGLAFTHTGATAGEHEYWIADFGTASSPVGNLPPPSAPNIPPADGLFPSYKFFETHDASSMQAAPGQAIADSASIPWPGIATRVRSSAGKARSGKVKTRAISTPIAVGSLQPRASGTGFDKRRASRFIPLLIARSRTGEWRGIPAAIILHTSDDDRGGAWLSFAVRNPGFYNRPDVQRVMVRALAAMRRGVYLEEGGANFFTYFAGQPVTLGARAINLGPHSIAATIKITVRGAHTVLQRQWPVILAPGATIIRSTTWKPTTWPQDGYAVTVTLAPRLGPIPRPLPEAGRGVRPRASRLGPVFGAPIFDSLSHRIYVWKPAARKQWITARAGQFWLNGKPWKVHGVNYMPSSGIGQDNGALFEYWLDRQAYDPVVVNRDLLRIRKMGLNAIAVFIYDGEIPSQNLLDLLRRCRELGIHADVSLRPGTPMNFLWSQIRSIIEYYHLPQNDTVFAYDLAWEPSLGNHLVREEWDPQWRAWIVDWYGSVAAAEKDWGFPAPREPANAGATGPGAGPTTKAGEVTNPPDNELVTDGPWRRMIAAYRRFADDLVGEKYNVARRLVRTLDTRHLISFRMTETSNPTFNWDGTLPYDFAGVATGVDFLAPEAYGRIGGWEQVKPGWFERDYARWAAPAMPMDWKEMGMSVWNNDRMRDDPALLTAQGKFFDAFYTMMERSGCNGIFYWWYPGGFRFGENSDFGIINPDGTDRPATISIRRHAAGFLAAPAPPSPNAWITFDRGANATGLFGVYQHAQRAFWSLIASGRTPGLRTAGTGSNSANCPAIAVGDVPWTGHNPPKYLNGRIDDVQIRGAGTGDQNPPGDRAALVSVTNTGEAEWLAGSPKAPAQKGIVRLVIRTGDTSRTVALPENLNHLGAAAIRVSVPPGPFTLYLEVIGRGRISPVYRY